MIALVPPANTTSRRDFVSFCNHVVDRNDHIREGAAERGVKTSKTGGTHRFVWILREPVRPAVGRKHFIDGILAALIPHFFKPTSHQLFVFF
jgi:hypothetical protein